MITAVECGMCVRSAGTVLGLRFWVCDECGFALCADCWDDDPRCQECGAGG